MTGEVSLQVLMFRRKFFISFVISILLCGVCRIILIVGFLIFAIVVLYVVSKRIGVLTLQRKILAAIKSGSNVALNQGIAAPNVNDEL